MDDSPPLLISGPSGSGLTTFTDILLHSVLGARRFQHAAPVLCNETPVGLQTPLHTELDVSAFSSLDEMQSEIKRIRGTPVYGQCRRRLLVVYRFHSCSFPHELLALLAHLHTSHWVIVVSHSGHLGSLERQRGFLSVRLAAPLAHHIRAHWEHVCSAALDLSVVVEEEDARLCASVLRDHWNSVPDHLVPRDWSLMYEQSREKCLSSRSRSKGPVAIPSVIYSVRDPTSIMTLVATWLTYLRQTVLPRMGVKAAISQTLACMERAGLMVSTPIQVAVWKWLDERWTSQIAPFANGQRSWVLHVILFCALTLHQPPFVRQFLPGIDSVSEDEK